MGQERLGPSYFFISLVLGPPGSDMLADSDTRLADWRLLREAWAALCDAGGKFVQFGNKRLINDLG